MFYVITYENGATRYGNFNDYGDALDYAENNNGGHDFTIDEYDDEESYFENL